MSDLVSGLPADWMTLFDPNVCGEGPRPVRGTRYPRCLVRTEMVFSSPQERKPEVNRGRPNQSPHARLWGEGTWSLGRLSNTRKNFLCRLAAPTHTHIFWRPNVEVGRRQSGQPLLSARSGLAVRAQPLVGILIFFPQNSNLFASSCLGLTDRQAIMGYGFDAIP